MALAVSATGPAVQGCPLRSNALRFIHYVLSRPVLYIDFDISVCLLFSPPILIVISWLQHNCQHFVTVCMTVLSVC